MAVTARNSRAARLALVFCFVCSLAGSCSKKDDEGTMKLGHCLPARHPVHKGMVKWSEILAEKSGGTLKLKIYESGQFGQEKELIEKCRDGVIDFTKVSSAALESFVPEMKVFGVPYLFRDPAHKWRVLGSDTGKRILDACERMGLVGIGYYEAGERSFYTIDTPIEKPGDLAGMKIRVIKSPMADELLKAMGASPKPISWGELYTALERGVVDGAENNPPSVVSARHYEVCKYYCLDRHSSPMDVVVANRKTWEALTADQRRLVTEAFDESVTAQRAIWEAEVKDNFALLAAEGVTIVRPDIEPFREAVRPMYEKYLQDDVIGPLIRKIRACGEAGGAAAAPGTE